jgi:hypothetical protein
MSERKHNPRNEKPISLRPLSLEEALGKAMNVSLSLEKYEFLVKHLAHIPINGHDRTRASVVANDLLKAVLKEQWHPLSDTIRKRLIGASTRRLWEGYMRRRKLLAQSPKEAAEEAINDELNRLEQAVSQSPDGSSPD